MKFAVQTIDLQKVLNIVSGVIPSKSTLPILENFLFEVDGSTLNITATDLDISMSVNVKVKGGANGKIAVPAKRLLDTMRSLPNTEISITADVAANRIVMKTQNGEY